MSNLKIAVQMDPHELLDKNADSTFALIEAAIEKSYKVYIYTVDDLTLENNDLKAFCKEVKDIDINKIDFIKLSEKKRKTLKSFDVILIRQDPPFNMKYLTATYLLEKVPGKTIVLNNPSSIRNSPEKLLVTNFYDLMPPTIISRNEIEIQNFLKIHKECIIKPLYGNGGKDVFFSSINDPNLSVIIEKFLEQEEHFIIQKFIKRVSKGDKRILLINGEPVGAINRVPNKSEIRANLHIGGRAKKTNLSKNDLKICKKIKKTLQEKELFFAGIDVIDSYLTEINVTSPTCIREIDYFNRDNIAGKFWKSVIKKYF
ncbi:MAG: glutathione synthase [Alphaproteobacteria bacterium TMED93]|nr:MAG: glutathione synthase [Alphaproteobacteria bacterium TMED93]